MSSKTVGKFKDKSKDNIRSNVQKRIKTALDKVSKIPKLNEILNKDIITTGYTCCYKPDPSKPVKPYIKEDDEIEVERAEKL